MIEPQWFCDNVLLVCGSRSLEPDPRTPPGDPSWQRKAQAFEALAEEMREWLKSPGLHLIIEGGAKGPDRWAKDLVDKALNKRAWAERIAYASYCPDGWCHTNLGRSWKWHPTGLHPLKRNEYMIQVASDAHARGAQAMVLAIRDTQTPPGKGGTSYTIKHAELIGLVARIVEV